TIAISAVNDRPSFAIGPDVTVETDDPAQSITGWAQDIFAGADNESDQVLTFYVATSDDSLFATDGTPQISPTGTLTFTPEGTNTGTATVTVTLKDDGSNEAPNINTTVAATFTITIDSANNPPTFTKGGDETVEEDSPARTVENWASG
ncbi:MAG: hypothetical protein ACKPBG_11150, partial [Actinomycetota bacterium]